MPDLPPDDLLRSLRDAVSRLSEQLQALEERIARLEASTKEQVPDSLPGTAVNRPPPVATPLPDQPTETHRRPSEEIVEAEVVSAELVEEKPEAAPPAGAPFKLSDEKIATVHSVASDASSEESRPPRGAGPTFPRFDFEKPVDWETFVGGKLLTWVGSGVVIIAIAFAIHWAWKYFETPDWLKVLAFHALGIGFLALGHYLDRRLPELRMLAAGMAGLGIFTLYGIAFAALHLYEIWGPHTAFAECSVITVLAIAISLRANSKTIILLGALGGYLTPLVANSGRGEYVGWFLYLAFLNVALIGTAVLRGWNFLKPLSWAATAVMFGIWFNDTNHFLDWYDQKLWPTQWLMTLHFVIFLVGTTLPPIAWKRPSTQFDLVALVGGSMWFVGATWHLFHNRADQQMALVSWGMAALHLALFAATYQRVSNVDRMPRVQLALSAIFFTLAVPLQLDDMAFLSTAWCVEGLAFAAVCVYFRDRQIGISALIVFMLAAGRLMVDFFDAPRIFAGTDIDMRFMITACAGLLALAAGLLFLLLPKFLEREDEADPFEALSGAALLAVGNVVLMLSLTRQWDDRFVLLAWLVIVAAVWWVGFRRDLAPVRWYAAVLAVTMVGSRALWHGSAVAAPFELLVNTRFASLALVAALYLAAGWMYRQLQLAHGRTKKSTWADGAGENPLDESICDPLFGLLGNAVLLFAITMEIHSWYVPSSTAGGPRFGPFANISMAEQATYSVVWAIYAAVLVGVGFAVRYQLYRWLGLAGFAAVLAKVFLVDLSELELFPRVLAFAVLGLTLLGVSFLYQKFKRPMDDG